MYVECTRVFNFGVKSLPETVPHWKHFHRGSALTLGVHGTPSVKVSKWGGGGVGFIHVVRDSGQ